jgi:hypothetical protein
MCRRAAPATIPGPSSGGGSMRFARHALLLLAVLTLASSAAAHSRDIGSANASPSGPHPHHFGRLHTQFQDTQASSADQTASADGAAVPDRDANFTGSLLRYSEDSRPVTGEASAPAYAMSYGEEIARKLGLKDGHIDLMTFRTSQGDDFGLVLSKGVNGNSAMIGLQWRP